MYIYKVIANSQDVEDMEKINKMTGMNEFDTENWCDLEQFELHPKLKDYLTVEEFEELQKGNVDYIAFKVDR